MCLNITEFVPGFDCIPFLKDHPTISSLDVTLTHPCLRESIKVYGLIIAPLPGRVCGKSLFERVAMMWWWLLAHGKICTNAKIFSGILDVIVKCGQWCSPFDISQYLSDPESQHSIYLLHVFNFMTRVQWLPCSSYNSLELWYAAEKLVWSWKYLNHYSKANKVLIWSFWKENNIFKKTGTFTFY